MKRVHPRAGLSRSVGLCDGSVEHEPGLQARRPVLHCGGRVTENFAYVPSSPGYILCANGALEYVLCDVQGYASI